MAGIERKKKIRRNSMGAGNLEPPDSPPCITYQLSISQKISKNIPGLTAFDTGFRF